MKQVEVFEKEYTHTHTTEYRVVGCWPEKAQQRVVLLQGVSDERQHGVKGTTAMLFCCKV